MEEKGLDKRHKRMYLVSSVLVVAVMGLCLVFSVQVLKHGYVSIGGYSVFRVVTGSMEPEIPNGALLICRKTDISEIKENDIICYKAKVEEIRGAIITHRVMKVENGDDGAIYLETKGDANLSTDPYYADKTNLIGKVSWYSGKGTVFTDMLTFLSGKIGFFACIVFPILLASGLMLQSAVSNMQKDIYRLKRELAHQKDEEDLILEDGDELLPGYTTLTYADYEAIYETLKKELLEELHGNANNAGSKTK